MGALERPWTYRDLQDTTEDGVRRDVIGGLLLEDRSFPRKHQEVSSNLLWVLQQYLRQSGAGVAFPPRVDVYLGPYDVVQPDIVVIQKDRLGIYQPEGIVAGPPDIVVEITSPCSFRFDHVRKMALYAREGVPEYWIANPDRRTFAMHTLQNGIYSEIGVGADGLITSDVFPGLRVDPKELFVGLED
jgi:Uma2 family endonuclease